MNVLTLARYFATVEHVTVKRQMYGVLPYTHHLQDVERVLVEFGITEVDLLACAWLHDVREDCGIKDKQIREMFTTRIAGIVEAVTDEKGDNRKVRKALTYPKIRNTLDAVLIKLADRIANVRQGGSLVEMYQKEHEEFTHALKEARVQAQYIEHRNAMWRELHLLLL